MALTTTFLSSIRTFVHDQDGAKLRNFLLVEPPVPENYFSMGQELRTGFPAGSKLLEQLIEKCLPEADDVPEGKGSPWPGFVAFMKDYLEFWRDVDFDDLLATHQQLSGLLISCSSALSHPTYGTMMLQTCISFTQSLSNLALMLHRRPELTMAISKLSSGGEERKSIVESTAEVIQKIFTMCLTDRTSARYAKPEGKKVGIYIFANKVLKLLFASRRTRLANQLFTNIATNSPPLSLYPASQRVTYLYYLGRFYLVNAHFRRASLALSEAYAQCPPAFQRHRTQILSFLIPANLLIGRLPSAALLSRPEAATGLAEIFAPLAEAVRTGSFVTLQTGLARHESWLWQRGLLLTLTYRLRPLVWRSLARKTFLLTYVPPPPGPEAAGSRRAATLSLADLLTVAKFVQRQLEAAVTQEGGDVEQQEQSQQIQQQQSALAAAAPPRVPSKHAKSAGVSSVFLKAVSNATTAATRTAAAPSSTKGQARRQRRLLRPNEGLLWGSETPSLQTVEAIVASLVQQGLMHGFIAHGQARFAVTGTRGNRARGSAVRAGWPDPATVLGTVGWRDEPHAAGGGLDQQPDAAVGEPFEVGVPGWVEDRR